MMLSPRTQLFSTALKLVMERNGISQSQIAAATRIAVSRINNYLHGHYRTIRPDHLERIVQVVARNTKERSELVRAYLLDLLPEVLQSETEIRGLAVRAKPDKRHALDLSELPTRGRRGPFENEGS